MSDAGLYVHIPFCLSRCGYCDFNTYDDLGHLAGRYVEALGAEAGVTA
ncbi:MAG TPA: coproporphyrinogen III oxidase, partial [Actinomycetota bacterium]